MAKEKHTSNQRNIISTEQPTYQHEQIIAHFFLEAPAPPGALTLSSQPTFDGVRVSQW